MKKHAVAIVLVSVLVGCASTGYQDADQGRFSSNEGYSVSDLGGDRWQIEVKYNAYTSEQRGEKIGMLRAATLAYRWDYAGFLIKSKTPLYRSQSSGGVALPGGMVVASSSTRKWGYSMTVELSDDPDAIAARETIEKLADDFDNYRKPYLDTNGG